MQKRNLKKNRDYFHRNETSKKKSQATFKKPGYYGLLIVSTGKRFGPQEPINSSKTKNALERAKLKTHMFACNSLIRNLILKTKFPNDSKP